MIVFWKNYVWMIVFWKNYVWMIVFWKNYVWMIVFWKNYVWMIVFWKSVCSMDLNMALETYSPHPQMPLPHPQPAESLAEKWFVP
jgi:hypothetical protein